MLWLVVKQYNKRRPTDWIMKAFEANIENLIHRDVVMTLRRRSRKYQIMLKFWLLSRGDSQMSGVVGLCLSAEFAAGLLQELCADTILQIVVVTWDVAADPRSARSSLAILSPDSDE